jgi:hypothetical protein
MFYLPKGRKKLVKGFYLTQNIRFGDSCQRGRKYEPKAKGPHHHFYPNFKINGFQLENFKLVSPCVLKGEQVVFSKLDILKPS